MTLRDAGRLLLAAGLIGLALILPARPGPVTGWLRLTPELPLILLLLSLAGRWLRPVVAAGLTLLVAHKIADLAMSAALGRGFNLRADLPLIEAGLRLVAGSFGVPGAVAVAVAAVVALVLIGVAAWWACGVWSRIKRPRARVALAGLAAVALILVQTGAIRADAARYAAGRVALFADTIRALHAFRDAAAHDPFAGAAGLLDVIDRDVLVIFVESYGRTSFDTALYADTHLPTLRRAEAALADAGLAMRSGFLTAPTRGGQSWLSHATLATGLWIADQTRYRAALVSDRMGLFHHAQAAGFHTAAVMPAITLPWPEASRMGFDTVLPASDLGYRGLPFNWVTMPDQFTLAALDRLLRDGREDRRLFAQIALISSHAPWVPVPRLLDWSDIGDGRVFNQMAQAGDPPELVWRDRDRVRDQYRQAVDYSLQVVVSYAALHAADPPLILVIGDHQTAPRIALDERPDVPFHVIGPEALVARTVEWGLHPGLIPPPEAQPLPMDHLRDLILGSFGGGPPA
ncbi:MAG: sulfatase-like hydrolase/transferase [Paracoccus sp. (in: a-proteobacteria)]